MPESILVFDIGLTNGKVVLFDHDGRLLARASAPYPTHHPRPDWAEQAPEDWWDAFLSGVRELRELAPEAFGSVAAISITGHMHALVCLGGEGRALFPALVLGDQRSLHDADAVAAKLGLAHIYGLTGARMDASMPLAKLCWLRRHAPEVHRHARAFLSCKDWLRHRLTGDLLTDPIDACGMSLYDIGRRQWAPDLVACAGIQFEQLPQVADPCAVAGPLLPEAARLAGLPAGVPVVVGAGDDVEVLGNAMLAPGRALEHLGTTGSILTCTDRPVFDPEMAIELYPHVLPDMWVMGGSVTAAGSALAWAQQVLRAALPSTEGTSSANRPRRVDLEHPLVFVPHLLGERCPAWEPHTRGGWIGLTSTHTAGDLHAAVLEGIAFSLRSVLERIERLVGRQDLVSVSGRDGNDDGWLRLRAAIYRRPLALLKTAEPTALGAMIIGVVGAGLCGSVSEAVQRCGGDERVIAPAGDQAGDYDRLYSLYCEAADAVGRTMRRWNSPGDAGSSALP